MYHADRQIIYAPPPERTEGAQMLGAPDRPGLDRLRRSDPDENSPGPGTGSVDLSMAGCVAGGPVPERAD